MKDDPRFDVPRYTVNVAAFHLKMPSSTLRTWTRKADLLTTLPAEGLEPRLPFVALIEAQLYQHFRREGLSMQAVTSGMRVVRQELGSSMLKKGTLAHDGRDILMNLAEQGDPDWERACDRQGGIPKIIEVGMYPVEYLLDDYPGRLWLTAYGAELVMVDPRFAFGQPVLASSNVRVEDIYGLWKAGDTMQNISYEMNVPLDDIESIVRTHSVDLAA